MRAGSLRYAPRAGNLRSCLSRVCRVEPSLDPYRADGRGIRDRRVGHVHGDGLSQRRMLWPYSVADVLSPWSSVLGTQGRLASSVGHGGSRSLATRAHRRPDCNDHRLARFAFRGSSNADTDLNRSPIPAARCYLPSTVGERITTACTTGGMGQCPPHGSSTTVAMRERTNAGSIGSACKRRTYIDRNRRVVRQPCALPVDPVPRQY